MVQHSRELPTNQNVVRKRGGIVRRQQVAGLGFVLPALLVLVIFLAFPVFRALYISFTSYDLISAPVFVGLKNYTDLFRDPTFWNSVRVTLLYILGSALPIFAFSLFLAILLNQSLKGSNFFKFAIFAPVVISEVVTAVVWRFLFHPYGLSNETLRALGLIQNDISWLQDTQWVLPAFIVLTIWKQTGYFMVIFLTGLQTISQEYYDAAKIDGANTWAKFQHITFPLLRPTTIFVVIMMLVVLLNTFTPFFVMTGGGPAGASEVISLLMYKVGFNYLDMGRATAISILLMLSIAVISVLQFRFMREDVA